MGTLQWRNNSTSSQKLVKKEGKHSAADFSGCALQLLTGDLAANEESPEESHRCVGSDHQESSDATERVAEYARVGLLCSPLFQLVLSWLYMYRAQIMKDSTLRLNEQSVISLLHQ